MRHALPSSPLHTFRFGWTALLTGNFGQANYSAAKMGLVAFTKNLAREGAKYGIQAVTIAPVRTPHPHLRCAVRIADPPAGPDGGFGHDGDDHASGDARQPQGTTFPSASARTCSRLVLPQPEFVAPFVAAVTHPEGPDASGKVFEVGAGYVAEIRWERSKGAVFKTDPSFTPSAVRRVPPALNSLAPAKSHVFARLLLGKGALGPDHRLYEPTLVRAKFLDPRAARLLICGMAPAAAGAV